MQNKEYVFAGGALVIGFLCGLLVSTTHQTNPILDCMNGMTGVYFFESSTPDKWILETTRPVSCDLTFDM